MRLYWMYRLQVGKLYAWHKRQERPHQGASPTCFFFYADLAGSVKAVRGAVERGDDGTAEQGHSSDHDRD